MAEIDITNDEVLARTRTFNVSASRKINVSFQSWEFHFGQTIEFRETDTPSMRRAIILKALGLSHGVIKTDIQNTIPEIRATIGNSPDAQTVIETVEDSVRV